MNNFLPLLLIMMLATGKQGGGFSAENLAPLLKMTGMDTSVLDLLGKDGGLSGISNGNFSLEKLLPLAMKLMSGGNSSPFGGSNAPTVKAEEYKSAAENQSATPNYLKPISDIAGEEVNYALAHYFANN